MLRAMRRWGDSSRFLERIEAIRAADPDATFRSSFILGYPGESEDDQRELLEFVEEAQLDWAGFFTFSREEGTYANDLEGQVPHELALERLREVSELQDSITARRRDALVGTRQRLLIDSPGVGRSVRECPEIDGIVMVDSSLSVGSMVECDIVASHGTDLEGVRV
jgi:ribosomal protein S12 methylthiotransferase